MDGKNQSNTNFIIETGYMKDSNFDDMYQKYTPEQLEELSIALKETIQFLSYQKDLSVAYHKELYEDVQRLQENKIAGNLFYLRRDEGWLLRVLSKEHKHK